MSYTSPFGCLDIHNFTSIAKKLVRKDADGNLYVGMYGLGPGFCEEYQAVYDAYTGYIPDATQAAAQNAMVEGMIADGVWEKLDIFYVYANSDTPNCFLNWINPALFQAVPVNGPVFTAWEGLLGNGVNNYVTCGGWIPSVNGVNYQQNSASQLIYCRTIINTAGLHTHGVVASVDSKDIYIGPRVVNSVYARNNNANNVNVATGFTNGLFINTRTAAAVQKVYRNKIAIINGVTVSSGAPTYSPYCLAHNANDAAAGFRADQVACYAFGGGFTQDDVDNFTDRFETYMDFLGKGIIP